MLDLDFIHKYIRRKSTASVRPLKHAPAPLPDKASGPFLLQADELFFALRFDIPLTKEQIGTPTVALTLSGRVPERSTMTFKGQLSVCENETILDRFRSDLYNFSQYRIMCVTCTSIQYKGRTTIATRTFY